jgi:predicted transcriptional regulator
MDTVYLYFISKKKQEEIMTILGKSQPAVSYDVSKIREQIDFIVKIISSVDDFIMFITDPENNMKTSDK